MKSWVYDHDIRAICKSAAWSRTPLHPSQGADRFKDYNRTRGCVRSAHLPTGCPVDDLAGQIRDDVGN